MASVAKEQSIGGAQPSDPRRWRRYKLLFFAPPLAFAGLLLAFVISLNRNPGEIPSVLIGKPVPEFILAPVEGRDLGLSTADLKGSVSLVNVFASWCVPCREEHPLLMQIRKRGTVPIYGINYKDKPDDAAHWLDAMGDPYARTGADLDGRVAIDWGVYGVPETFVVDQEGRIAYKHIGVITPDALEQAILPLIATLNAKRPETAGASR